jgi:DNA processing protein
MDIQGQFLPKKLIQVRPEIKGLWWKGDKELVNSQKIVAIVGSRKMSQYGKRVLAEIVPRLVEAGYVTISGFMYGIDIEMHRLTIESGGKTIGVFGWGIDAPIIPENENLYHKVLESEGLFLSEIEPKMLGELWTFPRRNRIVVGLAEMVIVVEAGMKSGSLNSAEWARKMGKPVYAVPGSIFSSVSEGCNWLIAQGFAKPMMLDYFKDTKQKVGDMYSEKVRMNRDKTKISIGESNLITLLTIEGPQSVNELSRRAGKSVGEVSAMLMSLLLRGEVQEERGVWKFC